MKSIVSVSDGNFGFKSPPSWRETKDFDVEVMIEEIIDFQNDWNTLKTKIQADRIEDIHKTFRKKYCDSNTDPMEKSRPGQKEQDSQKLGQLLEYLENIKEEEVDDADEKQTADDLNEEQRACDAEEKERDDVKEEQVNCSGFIEKSMVQNAHKIAYSGTEMKKGHSLPGEFSTQERHTTYYSFKDRYEYPKPDDMVKEVDGILDSFNSLLDHACCKADQRERLKGIFKSLAWFLFEILDLHPFGDGNGRVFRAFCHYVLFSRGQTVVPCPLYNVCCNTVKEDHSLCNKPCKDSYVNALIKARESGTRHPKELATMLVESCWKTWHEFMKEINQSISKK